jgi:hypothetical protein
MTHERGDVPGPTAKAGKETKNSAPPGQQAARATPSSGAPLSSDEGTGAAPGTEPDPAPDNFHNSSEGESARRTPNRGSGLVLIPGERA